MSFHFLLSLFFKKIQYRVRYFDCQPNFGIFVAPAKVTVAKKSPLPPSQTSSPSPSSSSTSISSTTSSIGKGKEPIKSMIPVPSPSKTKIGGIIIQI